MSGRPRSYINTPRGGPRTGRSTIESYHDDQQARDRLVNVHPVGVELAQLPNPGVGPDGGGNTGGGAAEQERWANFISDPLLDVPAGTTLGPAGTGADLDLTWTEGENLGTSFGAMAFRGEIELYYDTERIHYDQTGTLSPTFRLASSTGGVAGTDLMDRIVVKDEYTANGGYSGTFWVYVKRKPE